MPREIRSNIGSWRPLTLGNPHPLVGGVAVVEVDPQAIAAENIALDEAKGDLLDQVHAIAAVDTFTCWHLRKSTWFIS